MDEKQALQLIVNFINTKSEARISEFNQVNEAIELLATFVDSHQAVQAPVALKKPKKN